MNTAKVVSILKLLTNHKAISFVLIYVPTEPGLSPEVNLFFATVVIAVGISDLLGPFLVRDVLERAGELDRRVAYAQRAGSR